MTAAERDRELINELTRFAHQLTVESKRELTPLPAVLVISTEMFYAIRRSATVAELYGGQIDLNRIPTARQDGVNRVYGIPWVVDHSTRPPDLISAYWDWWGLDSRTHVDLNVRREHRA
jgi:hypothetical protein